MKFRRRSAMTLSEPPTGALSFCSGVSGLPGATAQQQANRQSVQLAGFPREDCEKCLKFPADRPKKISEDLSPPIEAGRLTNCIAYREQPEKGKPSERLGRKITGLRPSEG